MKGACPGGAHTEILHYSLRDIKRNIYFGVKYEAENT